ncbi:MAG TPA: competence/damage-inducible protein A [Polyangiaceae bacterium]|nr:competence/damage-inducible protein A [Polyangiaceae bacterium]
MTLTAATAAALIIGNELLSGKIAEANLFELARLLRVQGIRLQRAVLVPDEIEVIEGEIRSLRQSADVVFTSGGVGPTHDDVTVAAAARAFGVDVVPDPLLTEMLREYYGERCNEAHLRMALVPRGATLLRSADVRWPAILMGNVFLLPGVPEIFRSKLPLIKSYVQGPEPFFSRAVYLSLEEPEITAALDSTVPHHPDVEIGSYPQWVGSSYKTKVTFDGRRAAPVQLASDEFLTKVERSAVVRVE